MAKRSYAYTRKDYDELKRVQRLLHDLLPECDKLEACGKEADGYRAIIAEIAKYLTAIETHYFTPPPER